MRRAFLASWLPTAAEKESLGKVPSSLSFNSKQLMSSGRLPTRSSGESVALPRAGLLTLLADRIADWGKLLINSVVELGTFAIFVANVTRWMMTRLPRKETMLPSLHQVGVNSLPVVALTGTFIGMVMAVQSHYQFHELGLETRLGAVINMTLVRELGPVLAATMLAGRVGSAMAAELGTMRVTEQIDALESMGTNATHYLVVPRFLSCLLLIPTLTVVADFMGVAGGHFLSVYFFQIDVHHYWSNSASFVGNFDLFSGIIKSVFFGGAIALVGCYQGFHCGPGAEGVGQAATTSFVYSFIMILVLDLFIGILLDSIAITLWPEGASVV